MTINKEHSHHSTGHIPRPTERICSCLSNAMHMHWTEYKIT